MKTIFVGALFALFVGAANATLLFEIERTSDNQAVINASGVFDSGLGDINNHMLMFDDLFSFTSPGNPYFGSAIGISYDLGGSYERMSGLGPGYEASYGGDFYIYSEIPAVGWEISGSALIDASATDWIINNAGYIGNVYSGMPDGELAGSFTIVTSEVAEPGTLALMMLGLLGLGRIRRHKA